MIRVAEHKKPQHDLRAEKYLNPKKLYVPLSQHTGAQSLPCVKKGDVVKEGALIAKKGGFVSADIHAPCGGKIINIDRWFHPNLKRSQAIVIQCDGSKKEYSLRTDIKDLKKAQLLEIIANSGIVGLGGAAFPTHIKLSPPKPIDTLIINGCECEPYLATDYRLMIENLEEIFKGIEIISKLINPKEFIFAIEENKHEAVKKINLLINTKKFKLAKARSVILKSVYPQGGEKQLIYATMQRKVPSGKLPFDAGCLVHNVATAFAIYEAVYFDKPLIERLVCFCGDALVSPKNIWVKTGMLLSELFEAKILEFKTEPKKIVCGGPMMGVNLDCLDYPIVKGSGGFLFLNRAVVDLEESSCIRCARCVDTCPMNLLPLEYVKLVKKEQYEFLADFHINDCIECGCCSYGCPAKIPIVQYIKIGKKYAPKNN